MNKEKAIIIDLDGTLANIDERRKFLNENNNFSIFYSNISKDKLNVWCKEIIDKFKIEYKIIIITGREEVSSVREDTLNWLEKHNIYYDKIFFRQLNDKRKDATVKEEIYLKEIKNKYNILFVIDDRKQVIQMWRNNGLISLQCDWGDF